MRHIAIIGSGPAGYYSAEAAQKRWGEDVRVDVFDMLPVPYGLIRTGVAPDHQSIKGVSRRYEQVALTDNVRFVGNVKIGEHVSVSELQGMYDAIVIATGAPDYPTALDWTAEVYRAAGKLLAETGRLQGVADEGGFWPAFDTNEAALDTLLQAIERAGHVPGEEVAISLDIAASDFGKGGRYRLARDCRELDSDGMAEMLLGWLARYPIVSIEDPLGEDDADGLARFTAAAGPGVQVVADDFVTTYVNAQHSLRLEAS